MVTYDKIKEYLGLAPAPKGKGKKKKKISQKEARRALVLKSLIISSVFIGIIIVVGTIGLAVMIISYSRQLPPPGKPFAKNIEQNTNIYDRNNVLLASLYTNVDRKWVSLSDINDNMKWAMLAAEDINFYHEPGIDIMGIFRAAFRDVTHTGSLQGASTITQQLAKIADLTQDRTIQRKIKELILTLEIEKQYSKNQILEAYLNQIPFGGPTSGIRVAAEDYFNTEPANLTLAQSAFLAAIPNSPSIYTPIYYCAYGDHSICQANAVARANYVLDQMLKHANETHVTKAQIDQAKKDLLTFSFNSTPTLNGKAPQFVEYVKQQLATLGFSDSQINGGGLQVTTTLDYNLQQVAQAEIDSEYCTLNDKTSTVFKFYQTATNGQQTVTQQAADVCKSVTYQKRLGTYHFEGDDAGMISMDPKTGEVLAMVGSPTGGTSVNMMTSLTGVQPGSSIKPMLYMSAFKNLGMSPSSILPDVPISIPAFNGISFNPPYSPTNFGGEQFGLEVDGSGHQVINTPGSTPVNVDLSLSNSLNIPAVQALYSLGFKNFTSDLKSVGYAHIMNQIDDNTTVNILDPATDPNKLSFLSDAIGGENVVFLEHVNAYATIANGGVYHPATVITKVTDPYGKVLYSYDVNNSAKNAIDPAYPYMINQMLTHYKYLLSVGKNFTPQLFTQGYSLAGKTGTNNTTTGQQNASSLTFVGYTPDLVSGFWFGNQQQGVGMHSTGGIIPEGEYLIPFWGDYMEKVLPKFPKDSFQRPSDVIDEKVCADSGLLYQDGKSLCDSSFVKTATFQKDHLPKVDDQHQSVQVCNSDPTKLATPDMINNGGSTQKVITTYKSFDPFFQSAVDSYLQSKLNYTNSVPTAYCTDTQGILITLNSPKDGTSYVVGNQVSVDVQAISTVSGNSIAKVEMFFNGTSFGTLTQNGSSNEYTGSFTMQQGTPAGSYPFYIKATDSAGNTNISSTISITVASAGGQNGGSGGNSGNTNSVAITAPNQGSIVLPSPVATQLQMKVTTGDPMHITSAYFDVFSNGSQLNSSHIQATRDTTTAFDWNASYAFPAASHGHGYSINACAVITGVTNPVCSSEVVSAP